MTSKFRNLIAAGTINVLQSINNDFQATSRSLASKMRIRHDGNQSKFWISLPTKSLTSLKETDLSAFVRRFPFDDDDNNSVTGLDSAEKHCIKFHLNTKNFTTEVLKTTLNRPIDYEWSRNALFPEIPRRVIVEFSSPNIAKPFHIGHFRSTVIGNFIANINEAVGNKVTRINYLGDWGTQFGILIAGMEEFSSEIILGDSIQSLLDVYIKANKLAEVDEHFAMKAKRAFRELEDGDKNKIEFWEHCRKLTILELEKNYRTLNIKFDHYHGESMYSRDKSASVLAKMSELGLLKDREDGRTVVELERSEVTVRKSDGSGLYISRDIAAALDRAARFNFDWMFYVVDNSQGIHFNNLFEILRKLNCSWADSCQHVKFGKIQGLSTRKGNIVYLRDILEEATSIMLENQEKSSNTRVAEQDKFVVAEQVGISSLIVNDLKQRRTKDYKFSWERALSDSGDTGVKLQYTHARLCSLLAKCGEFGEVGEVGEEDEPGDLLTEPCALELVFVIARYDEVLSSAYHSLEPHQLVLYLFSLCNATSKALKLLPVKSAGERSLSRARLMMFSSARRTLAEGLTVLGISPLDRI